MSLVDISNKFKTDKFHHGFADFYNKILFNYRNSNKHVTQENTWERKHLPVINAIFFYISKKKAKPQNGKRLWDKVSNEFQHGKNLEKNEFRTFVSYFFVKIGK